MDIDTIHDRLAVVIPDIQVERLKVTHPGDDDGLWFFTQPGSPGEVQLESPTGNCPFLIEADFTERRIQAATVDEAVAHLVSLFGERDAPSTIKEKHG